MRGEKSRKAFLSPQKSLFLDELHGLLRLPVPSDDCGDVDTLWQTRDIDRNLILGEVNLTLPLASMPDT